MMNSRSPLCRRFEHRFRGAIRFSGRRLARRPWASTALALTIVLAVLLPGVAVQARQATPVATASADLAAEIAAIGERALTEYGLKAVILSVTIDGEEIITAAYGESMTGVPATTDMRFRNGAVAISYMSTLLLQLVDQGVVSLDDPLATWLPDLPDADRVTLRMLANMTAGYPDYVQNPELIRQFYADPFKAWTPEELIAIGLSTPRVFEPGTNWDYSHTNYVILGKALEAATGEPLDRLLQENVLDPLGLEGTVAAMTAEIPEPVLHAFTAERRETLGIPASTPFLEESTFWNPSWTLAAGSIETSTIRDLVVSAEAIGEGTLLSPESHAAQIDPGLLGFGKPLEGCPNCHTLDAAYNYGLGVVLHGDWILQNPLFAGYAAVEAYLPGEKIAIAVANTYDEASFDDKGNYIHGNASQLIYASIAKLLAPESVPPS
jgi:CubicO group peptidase (beta-lactamase class C family)